MKATVKYISLFMTAIVVLCSCNERKTRQALLPNISGKAGEVIVVIDKADWEGIVGNALRDSLACETPYLPQREPLFSLVNVPQNGFTSMFQVHRNIIVMNINPAVTEPGIVYRKDVWARPQTVIHINAADAEAAVEIIRKNSPDIVATLEQAERDRIMAMPMMPMEPAKAVSNVLPFLVRRLLKLSAREVRKDMEILRCFFALTATSLSG